MARVKKKVKKEKTEGASNSKLPVIIGSIAGVLLFLCLVGGLVVFLMENITPTLFKNSRDMDHATLVEMSNDKDVREEYEGTIYVLVYHSAYEEEEFLDYKLTDSQVSKSKSTILNDLRANELYEQHNVENSQRTAFYTIDLMDSDNEGLLADETFGYSEEKAYMLVITNTSSELKVSKRSVSVDYITNTISYKLTTDISKYE